MLHLVVMIRYVDEIVIHIQVLDANILVKYNSSGTLQWYRGIDPIHNSPLNARSESGVATDSDGNIYT